MVNYTQKNLIEAFRKGIVPGEKIQPKHRETVISNVFIFEDKVYKIYKNDNEFHNKNFRDISTREKRFDFTKKDFEWNRNLASEIYLELRGCRLKEGNIKFVDFDSAEELVIVMKKFREEALLSNRLLRGNFKKEDFFEIGRQLGMAMKNNPKIESEKNLNDIMRLRIIDVKNWVSLVDKSINSKIRESIFRELDKKFNVYIESIKTSEDKGTCPDVHLENLVFQKGKLSVIDSHSPKEIWIIADISANFYRPGSDIYMLAGEKSFREFKRGYIYSGTYLNDQHEDFFLLYSALIDWPYLYMLGEGDPEKTKLAKKFGDSVVKKYLNLK